MKKKIIILFSVLSIFFVVTVNISAWGGATHKIISLAVLKKLKIEKPDLLKNLNFDTEETQMFKDSEGNYRSLIKWVLYGAKWEDDGEGFKQIVKSRSDNHFHNPLYTRENWNQAGLSDIYYPNSGNDYDPESLILWAQHGEKQSKYKQGDNSWSTIRDYYYKALIQETENGKNDERENYFARTFKGLGHQMHLIQDSSVPAHVRNDSHILQAISITERKYGFYRCIETWADKNPDIITNIANATSDIPEINLNQPSFKYDGRDYVAITRLVDLDLYDGTNPSNSKAQGLAEYTNSNFFSEDTIFTDAEDNPDAPKKHSFPFPRKDSTNLYQLMEDGLIPEEVTAEDGYKDVIFYLKKIDHGEYIKHLLGVGYFEKKMRPYVKFAPETYSDVYLRTFLQNGLCYKDYVTKLIPRAVGYCTALLNYFFRGEIEITLPTSPEGTPPPQKDGIYAFTDQNEKLFKTISLGIRNITKPLYGNEDPEELKNGTITLVVRYRPCEGNFDDPFQHIIPVDSQYGNPPKPDPNKEIYKIYEYKENKDDEEAKIFEIIPREEPMRLDFDISNDPIPISATDLNMTVVFKGDIGYEKEIAVAVGFKDLSEPTPIDFVNDSHAAYLYNFNTGQYEWFDISRPCEYPYSSECVGSWKDAFNLADCNKDGRIACLGWEPHIYPQNVYLGLFSFNNKTAGSSNYYFHHLTKGADGNVIIPGKVGGCWDESQLIYKLEPGQYFRFYVLGDADGDIKMSKINFSTHIYDFTPCDCPYELPGIRYLSPFINKLFWNGVEYKQLNSKLHLHPAANSELELFKGKYFHSIWTYYELDVLFGFIPKSRIKKGEKTTLIWSIPFYCVYEVSIDNNIGPVEKEGTLEITPQQTTTYTITITDDRGTRTKTATIYVEEPESQ